MTAGEQLAFQRDEALSRRWPGRKRSPCVAVEHTCEPIGSVGNDAIDAVGEQAFHIALLVHRPHMHRQIEPVSVPNEFRSGNLPSAMPMWKLKGIDAWSVPPGETEAVHQVEGTQLLLPRAGRSGIVAGREPISPASGGEQHAMNSAGLRDDFTGSSRGPPVLDLHVDAVLREGLQDLLQGGNSNPLPAIRIRPSTIRGEAIPGVEGGDFLTSQFRDGTTSVGGSVNRIIVQHDNLSIERRLHVDLEDIRPPPFDRLLKGEEGVLRGDCGPTTMRDQERRSGEVRGTGPETTGRDDHEPQDGRATHFSKETELSPMPCHTCGIIHARQYLQELNHPNLRR